MEIRIFEYLLAVEEEKNITKAAERCFISQPALSKHIGIIEKRMGFPLFQKTGNGMEPTEKGKIYLDAGKKLLLIEKETLKNVEEAVASRRDRYSVFIDHTIYNFFMESIYPMLKAARPQSFISVFSADSSSAMDYLKRGQYDIGVFPFHTEPPSFLNHVVLNGGEFVLAVPDGFPCNDINDASFPEAAGNYRMFVSQELSFYREIQDSRMQYYNLSGLETVKAGSLRNTAAGIRNNEGISFIPQWHAQRYGCRWLPLTPQISYNFFYLYSSRRNLNETDMAIISGFRDHLK
ncbi:MAG: LysR family transcriptional regulator [Solobacterium sp.]|nr:LysR family transcriptional regulator [Solobacterium sp.]